MDGAHRVHRTIAAMVLSPTPLPTPLLQWDVFCRVIDNYGDIGVCWRLCADLSSRGHNVRLWIDDASALTWMAPGALEGAWSGVTVLDWKQSTDTQFLHQLSPADVWIEGFGCEIAPEFIAAHALFTGATGDFHLKNPIWINVEYLSAEGYVERSHGLSSPVMSGPGKGQTRYFYYPGFTTQTGGLIRERDLLTRIAPFKAPAARKAWFAQNDIEWHGGTLVSLFCYEPTGLEAWLTAIGESKVPTQFLVTAGLAAQEMRRILATATPLNQQSSLRITFLPQLPQRVYDELLALCDLNFVRGEDSLVRAIWAGKPFVWQIYPQTDHAHFVKLEALLNALAVPDSLNAFMRCWNGFPGAPSIGAIEDPVQDEWASFATRVCEEQSAQPDLVSQLVDFVVKKR